MNSKSRIPEYVGIEITRRCNQSCPHCFTASGSDQGPGIPTKSLLMLMNDLHDAGVRTIAFSGGEPLLRNDLEFLISRGRSMGLSGFGVVTNGTAVSETRARVLAHAGLTIAQVSLDGLSEEDYVEVRGGPKRNFHTALEAVSAFRDAGIRVDLACLLTARNLESAPDMALLAQNLGVAQLRYCTYVPTGRGRASGLMEKWAPSPDRLDAFLDFICKANSIPSRPLTITVDHGIGPSSADGSFQCGSGANVAYVAVDGWLYPCPGLIYPEFAVGNVFQSNVHSLLRSDAMTLISRRSKAESNGICSTCSNHQCSGGCRGLSYSHWRDVRRSPPYCRVSRRI